MHSQAISQRYIMTSLIYSRETKQTIDRISSHLPHALLIEGQPGVGLGTIATKLAGSAIAALIQPLDKDGTVDLSPKGIIRLSQIHELHEFTKGKSAEPRVYIIDNADMMNTPAQNAFLKLLEEPGESVQFILTAHQPELLLATVLSRVQRVHITPISQLESQHFIKTLGVSDSHKAQQLLFIGNGRPAEIARLASNDTYFNEQARLMNDARTLLSSPVADRLILLSQYASDRAGSLQLLQAAKTIVSFSLGKTPSRDLVDVAGRLAITYDRIVANGNTRLQLTNFVIQSVASS